MANDVHSKAAGKPPITRHPLFPATVALWFGALFGLSSLAISSSLIESVITALRIDAVISAAAPPLGATTRILLALALAGLGGLLGGWLARRIARPKPVTVTRRRGAGQVGNSADPDSGSAVSRPAGRRTRLAMTEEGTARPETAGRAAIPGAESILDVSQFELEGFEAPDKTPPEMTPAYAQVPEDAQVFQPAAISDNAPAAEKVSEPEFAAPREDAPAFGPPSEAPCNDEPVVGADHDVGEDGHVTFADAPEVAEDNRGADYVADPEPVAQPEHGPEFAAQYDPDPESDDEVTSPLQRLHSESAEPAVEDTRGEPAPFAARPPAPGSSLESKPAQGLFTQPFNAQVARIEWETKAAETAAREISDTAPDGPDYSAGDESAPAENIEPADTTAAQRIASANLDELSHLELLERLALSMQRKRATAVSPQEIETVQSPRPALADDCTGIDVDDPPKQTDEPAEQHAEIPSPPMTSLPFALRPVSLDDDAAGDDDEDDAQLLSSLVPPRNFSAPPSQAATTDSDVAAASAETRSESGLANADAMPQPDGSPDLDEGYSSLLNLSRADAGKNGFVRIEEPEPLRTEIEPMVVFPGQETRAPAPFAQPEKAEDDAAHAPGMPDAQVANEADNANEGADPAAPADNARPPFAPPADRADPAETDRALRAALANIQRISGAA